MVKSRKSTYSIMSHAGFGPLTVRKNGLEFIIPANMLTKRGVMKSKADSLTSTCRTLGDVDRLIRNGISITLA